MSRPEFVYVTYIRTTPEQLWEALTDPAFTARYWGATFDSDWAEGSTYAISQRGVHTEDPAQVVLESDPPRRLSYTWHTVTAELAAAFGWSDEYVARLRGESRSKVTFEIGPGADGMVRLSVTHDGFDEGSLMLESISGGWPYVLSNLKTLLETGAAQPPVGSAASEG